MMNLIFFVAQDRFFLSHVKDRAEYFARKGWKIHVLAQKTSTHYVEQIEAQGFEFYDTEVRRDAIDPITALKNARRIISLYKKISPQVVFHLGAKAIFLGTFATKFLTHLPAVINAPIGLGHVFICKTRKAKMLRHITVFLYKHFLNPKHSRVIVENEDDINFFLSLGAVNKDHIFLIPGAGIDTKKFAPVVKQNSDGVCRVVMVARLIREKGVYEFISVANRIYREHLPITCLLVGAPDFHNPSSMTDREYRDLQDNPALKCLGFTENVIPVLQQADIACLPSYREGLPRSLIEACSCGLPIVTTNTVGCREIVLNNNGLTVPVGDKQALYEALVSMSRSPEMREEMGKNSRKLALDRFETNKISEQTYKVVENLYGQCI